MKRDDCFVWETKHMGTQYRVILSKKTHHMFGVQKYTRLDDPFGEFDQPRYHWQWIPLTDEDIRFVLENVLHQLADTGEKLK